jgi:hypothetical protein
MTTTIWLWLLAGALLVAGGVMIADKVRGRV